jgi:Phage capsid protein
MSAPIGTLLTQQYTSAVELLLQQNGPRLRGAVKENSYIGEAANPVDQLGQVRPVKNRPRNSDTPLLSVPTDRRWIYPNDYEAADLIDQQDKLRTIDQVDNPYVEVGRLAVARAVDDEILLATFGTAQTGKNGATSTAFPGSQSVAANYGAAANTGLTVAKIRKVRQLLMSAGADYMNDPIFAAITTLDHDSMLAETQIINSDYFGGMPAVADGIVSKFLGINFIIVEFTDTVYSAQATMGGGTRQVPFWLKSGMQLGIWGDLSARIDERPDKSYATQWYTKVTCGSTRLQEKKVVQVLTV